MLAMKDVDGIVRARVDNIAHRARVSAEEGAEAVRVLSSPDPRTPDEPDQGIRIRKVDGGFLIVNHEKYRFSSDEKREYWRNKKAEERAKKTAKSLARRAKKTGPLNQEVETLQKVADGEITQEQADADAAETREFPG